MQRRNNVSLHRCKPKAQWRKIPAFFTAILFVIASFVFVAPAAHAANQVVLDNVQFVNEQSKDPVNGIRDGDRQYLQIDMSVPGPGPATAPVTGTIYLDQRLKATPQKIDILGEDGSPAGFCLVSETKLECSLFPEYVEAHPYDLQATVYFWVWVSAGNDETEDLEFSVGNTVTRPVEVAPRPDGAFCETDCDFKGQGTEKSGHWGYDATNQQDFLEWVIRTPAGPDGMEVGAAVTVRETIDLNEFEILPGYPKVKYFEQVTITSEGFPQLNAHGWLSAEEFTVSDDKLTVSFTVTPGKTENLASNMKPLKGRIYDVFWGVVPIDGWVPSATYENKAYVTVTTPGGSEESEDSASVQYQGGGGNVIGTDVGRVYVAKAVEGDNPPPAGTSYVVDWKACDTANDYNAGTHTGADCREGEVTVTAGDNPDKPSFVRIGDFRTGWRVKATEQPPANIPPNTDWSSEWEWINQDGTSNAEPTGQLDTTIGGGQVAVGQAGYFRVTNTFTKQQTEGQFGAKKELNNSSGFDLENQTYELRYSYPASEDFVAGVSGFPAGSGSLMLPGDGSVIYSDTLPVGAQLTFTEVLPEVQGVDWGTPQIVPASLTISEDSLTAPTVITVTNSATASEVATGHFIVRKTIDNPSGVTIPNQDQLYFTLNYTVTAPGESPRNESIRVPADGELVSSPEFPEGTVIEITGEDSSDWPTLVNGEWTAPSWIPTGSFTITENPSEVETVVLSNAISATAGFFQAQKAFGDTAGLTLTGLDFTLNYEYPAGDGYAADSGQLLISGDGSIATSAALPIGAELTFSEGDMPELEGVEWEDAQIAPATLVIGEGMNPVTVVVTNSLNELPASPGQFSAQKLFDFPNDDEELIDLDGASFTLNYWYTVEGQVEQGPFELELSADGSPAFSADIPIGATVRVAEAPIDAGLVPNVTWGEVTISPSESFVMEEETQEIHILVTNTVTQNLGNFQVEKAIENPDQVDLDSVRDFTIAYDYYYGTVKQGSDFMTIGASGEPVTSQSLPIGTRIVITGEANPPAIPNASWSAPRFEPQEFIITGDGTPVSVVTGSGSTASVIVVTNTITQNPGTFAAFKDIVNEDGLHLEWFTFEVEYEYEFNNEVYGPFTLTLDANGDRVTSPEIPIGAEVTILGEKAPTQIEHANWEEAVIEPEEPFVIGGADSDPVTVRVENTVAVKRGEFSAFKSIVNNENVELPESMPGSEFPLGFVLDYQYTAVEGIPAGGGSLYLLPDGTPVTSGMVPYGSTVTVFEVDPGELPGYTWLDPELSADSFVMEEDTDATIVVEATNEIVRELMPFWATKLLNLEDGLTLPEEFEGFELEYTYTYPWVDSDADEADRGGSDTLLLTFNPETGEPETAQSIDLPHGTEVEVAEVLPVLPAGQYWHDPKISPEQFTIDAAAYEFVTVEVENTLSAVPPVPPILEVTGMLAPWLILLVAIGLLIAGIILAKRQREERAALVQ